VGAAGGVGTGGRGGIIGDTLWVLPVIPPSILISFFYR